MGSCSSKGSTGVSNQNRPNGIDSELVEKPKPLPSPDPKVIDVNSVDLCIANNTQQHHTDEYEITDRSQGDSRELLVIRRGQKFNLKIESNREYDKNTDDLRLVFQFGKRPLPTRGTHAEFVLSDRDVSGSWGAFITSMDGNTLNITVMIPPTCAVGKWRMNIDVVKRSDNDTVVYRYNHKDPIYVLFNPWFEQDQVYMHEKGEKLLDEYILNDTGKIYAGNTRRISPKPWTFGQFTGNILDCILYLLEMSKLKDTDRGDPVLVSRKLSSMLNDSTAGGQHPGVLSGNWTGDYSGGTSPLKWTGSVAILEQYFSTKKPVRYGQCWVFSGLFTTACRAIGIPARSVTNFASAHDTDGSVTIDYHYSANGEELEHKNYDSVWNFHVWNDVWMARPDLPQGYGGWQAVDATPQEKSDGVYCMGPMSLEAIKRGEVSLLYDGKFVFAEVNGDKVYWMEDDNKVFKVTKIKESSVGKYISTKRPLGTDSWRDYRTRGDPDREDVTLQYKFKDGSEEERAAVKNANKMSTRDPEKYAAVYKKTTKEDVSFELKADDDMFMGDMLEIDLKITNTSSEDRTINGTLCLSSMYYTGTTYKLIAKDQTKDLILKSKEDKVIKLAIPASDYLDKMMDHCMCKMSCTFRVQKTAQVFSEMEDIRLRKPHLDIKAPEKGKVGESIEIEVSFDNPLDVTLKKCELVVDSPGFQQPKTYSQKDVPAKQTFTGKFEMTPKKAGQRNIIVYFNCNQIEAVTSSHKILVEK